MMSGSIGSSLTVLCLDEAVIAEQPLAELPYRDAVADRLRSLASPKDAQSSVRLEACTPSHWRLVQGVDCHPLVAALRLAYADHRPLRLSPDMIWLAICQGVAEHVRAHAEELRPQLVRHQGQIELEITVNAEHFHKGSPENPWPEALELFARRIGDHVGEKHHWFVPDFSTTGPAEKAAAAVVLMDAMEPYFRYKLGRIICGIPFIEIEGTPEDWRALADRADRFRELDLAWWIDRLQGILEQFCDAVAGNVDRTFWRSIYRVYQPDEPCTPQMALGWFTVLFPYLSKGSWSKRSWRSDHQRNPWLASKRKIREMLDPERTVRQLHGRRGSFVFESALPTGLSRVPFQWLDQTDAGDTLRGFYMEFLAGFFGIRQDRETMCLRPEIGWAVRDLSDPSDD